MAEALPLDASTGSATAGSTVGGLRESKRRTLRKALHPRASSFRLSETELSYNV